MMIRTLIQNSNKYKYFNNIKNNNYNITLFSTINNPNKDYNKIKFKISEVTTDGNKLINQYIINNNENSNKSGQLYSLKNQHLSENKFSIETIKKLFLPKGYPSTVTSDYIGYQKWMFFQNTLGSITYVLSTHALLTSVVGMSSVSALPFAAAVSWVLKDGLGAAALVLFANKYSTLFDYDIKKYKFRSDILHNLGVLLEMTTPFFQSFLIIASISNLLKGISGLIGGSSRASLNKSFSLNENIGDITAKNQSQGMAAYLTGMVFGSGIGMVLSISPISNLSIVFGLSFIHLFSGIRALKSLDLKSLNQQRLSNIIDHWLKKREILPSKIVNRKESFIFSGKYGRSPFIKLGSTIEESFKYDKYLKDSLNHSRLTNNNYYLISKVQPIIGGVYNSSTIHVLYFDKLSQLSHSEYNYIIIKSFFHAFLIRKELKERHYMYLYDDDDISINIEELLETAQIKTNEKFDQFYKDFTINQPQNWNFDPNTSILMLDIGETKIKLN